MEISPCVSRPTVEIADRQPSLSKNSHDGDGDVFDAALALVSLPRLFSTDRVHSEGDYHQPSITPQNSFDSFRVSNTSTPEESVHSHHSTLKHDDRDLASPKEQTLALDLATAVTALSPPNAESEFCGSVSLAMPKDEDNLSPLHCFVRKYGIEAFVASEREAQDTEFWYARNFRVKPGVVGMRCIHCSSKPIRVRGPKSVHYPSSVKCIYYSMENWQRHHASHCPGIPKWILRELKRLMAKSKTGSGGRRCYWAESAKSLGMVDTPEGVKFASNPVSNNTLSKNTFNISPIQKDSSETMSKTGKSSTPVLLVSPSDIKHISDYLYLLMSQMERCNFSEEDRTGSRSKIKNIKIGYPGLQCKHCHGNSGVGRYYPISLQNITLANSDRNMHNHLDKCRRCPENIRQKLTKLRTETQKPGRKIKRGARKKFFAKVWHRLHGSEDDASVSYFQNSLPDENSDDDDLQAKPKKRKLGSEEVPETSTPGHSNSVNHTKSHRKRAQRNTVKKSPDPLIQVNGYNNFTPLAGPPLLSTNYHEVHPPMESYRGSANSFARTNNYEFHGFPGNAPVHGYYPSTTYRTEGFNSRYDGQVFASPDGNRVTSNFAQL